MSCIHLIKVDKTPWHGDVFDHPIYEFYCSYTPGDNIKLPHQYICKNCKYFERDLENDYLIFGSFLVVENFLGLIGYENS